ncbi:amidohydrolase family protein [Eubacteriales bacterium OttesenSCG-928-G02]|nr:amidohydrolase family protein [Eubacteriales bacterium OttesenSCG-928-G02]
MISNRKIIDTHTHIFPERLAERAVGNIGGYYNIPMNGDGMGSTLIEQRKELPNIKFVICSATLKPEAMKAGNEYLIEQASLHDCFVPLSSFHPYMDIKEVEAELIRMKGLGTHGIKLHPDFQRFEIDDPKILDHYRLCAELELPVLFHIGDENSDASSPTRLYNVISKIPELKAVAAHLGGYKTWDEGEKVLIDTTVTFDVSDALFCLGKERFTELVRKYGSKRIMFGSDFPFYMPVGSFLEIDELEFTDEEKDDIFWNTAARVYSIK